MEPPRGEPRGDDRLRALAELPLCYLEPGAGVGSNGVSPYRRYEMGCDSYRCSSGAGGAGFASGIGICNPVGVTFVTFSVTSMRLALNSWRK
jgi:hypothetical protein